MKLDQLEVTAFLDVLEEQREAQEKASKRR